MVCAKHKKNPVKIYKQCIGCEIEGYRDENTSLRARLAEVEAQRDKWKKEFEWLKSKVVFDSDGDVV